VGNFVLVLEFLYSNAEKVVCNFFIVLEFLYSNADKFPEKFVLGFCMKKWQNDAL